MLLAPFLLRADDVVLAHDSWGIVLEVQRGGGDERQGPRQDGREGNLQHAFSHRSSFA
ncbi:MAG: hypothetical protein HC888_13080 [Candidatus Competibacteraceae bacterium]|nr:hypothetical protein [Candidatus Competibacteraceae bacterium]